MKAQSLIPSVHQRTAYNSQCFIPLVVRVPLVGRRGVRTSVSNDPLTSAQAHIGGPAAQAVRQLARIGRAGRQAGRQTTTGRAL